MVILGGKSIWNYAQNLNKIYAHFNSPVPGKHTSNKIKETCEKKANFT